MAFSRARAALRSLVVETVRRLPEGTKLSVMHGVRLRKKLDYRGADLYLEVSSPEEFFIRLRSCAKEPETVEWLESGEGDVVYDIGANVGAYSLVAARSGSGARKVYSFEPGFANYSQLCRNILLNGCDGQVVPLPIALSDTTGLAEFRFATTSPGAASQTLQSNGTEPRVSDSVQTVITWRLDDLVRSLDLQPPSLVKIDVDGGEVRVLEGASETLRSRSLNSVLVESGAEGPERDQVFEILEAAGFTLASSHRHKATNYIFVRNLHLDSHQ